MAIGEKGRPYIHSRIYNFHRQLNAVNESGDSIWKTQMDEIIGNLTNIRNSLKQIAYDFFGKANLNDLLDISELMFENENSYNAIVRDFFASKEATNILRTSYNDWSELSKDSELLSLVGNEQVKVIEALSTSDINIITEAVLEGIKKNPNITLGQKGNVNEIINNLFSQFGDKKMTESLVRLLKMKYKSTTLQGNLAKVIKKYLKMSLGSILAKENKKNENKKKESLIVAFKKYFLDRLSEMRDNNVVINNDANMFVEEICNTIRNLNFDNRTFSNIVGDIGEIVLATTINDDGSSKIVIEVVGDMNEEQIAKEYGLSKIETHHDSSKMSQTDLLLYNPRTKITVRAQSKNLVTAYQSILDERPFEGVARIQGSVKYTSLITQLEGKNYYSSEDLSEIEYLLANEIWFRTRGSIGESGGRKISQEKSGVSFAHDLAIKFFTKGINNYIGATFGYGINDDYDPIAANAFFVVGNKLLIPTYEIIDNLIKFVEDGKKQLISLRLTTNAGKIYPKYQDPMSLWNTKFPTGTSPDSTKEYEDAFLLQAGEDAGQDIIEQLEITNIGLNFDIDKLMKTSFVF